MVGMSAGTNVAETSVAVFNSAAVAVSCCGNYIHPPPNHYDSLKMFHPIFCYRETLLKRNSFLFLFFPVLDEKKPKSY